MNVSLDLSQCDREPVAFIGSIQSFGALIAVDSSTLKVVAASGNLNEFTEIKGSALGLSLEQVIPGANDFFDANSGRCFTYGNFSVSRQLSGKKEIYEIERVRRETSENAINTYLAELQGQTSLKDLLQSCADVVMKEIQFSRVMIYKFHEDLHGEVVAEAVKPGVDSFMGLHYPATDIPAPSRALFLEKFVRMIPDVSSSPVKVEGDAEIDLTRSTLRSASPIHIQYLKNMNVGASLTISLIVEGKLWGLIACHHKSPKLATERQRENCEIIGRMTSALIAEAERREIMLKKEKIEDVHRLLVEKILDAEDMGNKLTEAYPTILDLIDSGGASAALYLENHWASLGKVPSEAQLGALVNWLSTEHKDTIVYSTHNLEKAYPPAREFSDIGSGLLAVAIPKSPKNYVLWFRPEVVKTVKWAGNPGEKVVESNGRLSPRGSFELWKEEVKFNSLPWKIWETDAAIELRNRIMAVDLRRQYEKEQAARREAELAVKSREELVEIVSHDLRNPLTSLQMNCRLVDRLLPKEDVKIRDLNERMLRSVKVMNNLIEDILSVTKLESGKVDLEITTGDLRETIRAGIELLLPIATEKRISLEFIETNKTCKAKYDDGRILQVLSNLIGNSLKFTPENGRITVEIQKCGPEFATVIVSDTGHGIPKDHLPHVFDRFWQANQAKKMGTGLGLAIVKEIIKGHGGEISVESEPGQGTQFIFKLPMA